MKYTLVWGYKDFYGHEETVIKESTKLDMLEDAQKLLGDMYDDDLIKYLGIDDEVLNEGIYFRVKS